MTFYIIRHAATRFKSDIQTKYEQKQRFFMVFHVAASRAMHLAHLRLRDESFLIFPSYVNPQNMAAHAAEVEE